MYDGSKYILNYTKENGYQCAGAIRECYIDVIWNKESPDEWLTEVQLPLFQLLLRYFAPFYASTAVLA